MHELEALLLHQVNVVLLVESGVLEDSSFLIVAVLEARLTRYYLLVRFNP